MHLAAVETGLLGAERHCLLRVVIREKVCQLFFLFAEIGIHLREIGRTYTEPIFALLP